MKRFGVVVADPPWAFLDRLSMMRRNPDGTVRPDIRRSAESHYSTMKASEILALAPGIQRICADNCLLALWTPSSLVDVGLAVMTAWGFRQKQIYTWIKTRADGSGLSFGLGHYFRNTSEHALIGVRGKCVPAWKKERNVELNPALPHSQKPPGLQMALERMYENARRLELFARRDLPGWTCTGLECPSTKNQRIETWLEEYR
jgi:N6-adenosine-specific RNA methylase IME4